MPRPQSEIKKRIVFQNLNNESFSSKFIPQNLKMPFINLLAGYSNYFRPQSARPTFKKIFLITDNNENEPLSPYF